MGALPISQLTIAHDYFQMFVHDVKYHSVWIVVLKHTLVCSIQLVTYALYDVNGNVQRTVV